MAFRECFRPSWHDGMLGDGAAAQPLPTEKLLGSCVLPFFVGENGCFLERGYIWGYVEGLHFPLERGYIWGYIFFFFDGGI